jgi:hypothetical protein
VHRLLGRRAHYRPAPELIPVPTRSQHLAVSAEIVAVDVQRVPDEAAARLVAAEGEVGGVGRGRKCGKMIRPHCRLRPEPGEEPFDLLGRERLRSDPAGVAQKELARLAPAVVRAARPVALKSETGLVGAREGTI